MEDRLQRRNPIIQFIFDYWIYIAIGIIMWQLPFWLADFYNDKITGFESAADLRRWILRESGDGSNQTLNWLSIINNFYIVAILAMSYNLAFGFSGIISFGHALFFGFATYLMIILIKDYERSLQNAATAGILFGILFGLIMSLAVLRIKGVYFAMFSLALAEMFFQLSRIRIFKFLTNGDEGIQFGASAPEIATNLQRLQLYYVCAALAAATFIFIRLLMASPIGKVIVAIRENEARAETMGYNVVRYKTLVLVLSCTLAAMAGNLYALHASAADPVTVLGVGRTIDPLLMTIIGGTGTNPGPVVGAFVMDIGEEFFRDEALRVDLNFVLFHIRTTINTVQIWPVVLGIVFILIVLVVPYGIVGQINLIWLDVRRWIRIYLYNPLVRRNHKIAVWMKPITGEPPSVALAYAQSTTEKRIAQWVLDYPITAMYALILSFAFLGGLMTLDHRTFMTILLFLSLITSPITIFMFGKNQLANLQTSQTPLQARIQRWLSKSN
ncbi:MAG: hypothetical protein CUN55_06080 [Phototrophicales bacterium]|nr:MAG: hypothetical protein CUN55_06080 [Phototrophicales bacterium]